MSAVLLPVYAVSYTGQAVFAVCLGLYSGCCYALLNTLCLLSVDISFLATAFGAVLFSTGIGTFIGPPVAGMYQEYITFPIQQKA